MAHDWYWPSQINTEFPHGESELGNQHGSGHVFPPSTESAHGTPREGEFDDVAEYRQFCERNELIRNNPNNDTGINN